MVKITIKTDKNGVLKSCFAYGHAVDDFSVMKAGQNPVCLAVSILLYTVLEQLSKSDKVLIEWSAKKRGELFFGIVSCQKEALPLLAYGKDFLISALKKLVQQYPSLVELDMCEV